MKSISPANSFFGEYLDRMTENERMRIDVLVVSPDFAGKAEEEFGGSWTQRFPVAVPAQRAWSGWSFGVGLLESDYDLVLVRRSPKEPLVQKSHSRSRLNQAKTLQRRK